MRDVATWKIRSRCAGNGGYRKSGAAQSSAAEDRRNGEIEVESFVFKHNDGFTDTRNRRRHSFSRQ